MKPELLEQQELPKIAPSPWQLKAMENSQKQQTVPQQSPVVSVPTVEPTKQEKNDLEIQKKVQLFPITVDIIQSIMENKIPDMKTLKEEYMRIVSRDKKSNQPASKDSAKKRNGTWGKIDPDRDRIRIEAQKQQEILKLLQQSDGEKKIAREIKYQMNLLTAENFDVVKMKVLDLAQKEKALDKVINTVIEKAWSELKFASIYAKLCYFLQNQPCFIENGKNIFKLQFLQKIQDTFEGNVDVIIFMKTDAKSYDEMNEQEKKKFTLLKKKKILGNMNFIGELFLAKVIRQKIIDLINRQGFDTFLNDYQLYKILKRDEYMNFEDHLEGLLTLN